MANDLHRYGIMIHRKGTSYEDLILARQELVEILEDEPDSALCPIGFCWWDDIPEEDFTICQST